MLRRAAIAQNPCRFRVVGVEFCRSRDRAGCSECSARLRLLSVRAAVEEERKKKKLFSARNAVLGPMAVWKVD